MVLSHQTGVRIPVALPSLLRSAARPFAAALVAWGILWAVAAAAQPRTASRGPSGGGLPPNVERLDSLGGITEYRLRSNGMKILLSPNRAAPVITFLVVYHVGSRNEAPGNTGSAHLLEHMLFNKSTQNFGKANGRPTFQEVLYEAGADNASTNMKTGHDRMTGYSTVPSDRIDLAMRIEADRMSRAFILDSERRPEMSVVLNEYEIGENSPYRSLNKALIGSAIVAHPYHWPTLGYRSDLEGVSTETLRQHYRTYFRPDNAEAILVGDFDTAEALRLFDREFGRIPISKSPIPSVITVEPPQEGERRVTVSRPGQVGIVQIAWMRVPSLHPDYLALEVLTDILGSGVNSRLYQTLVEPGLATDVDAWNYTLRDPYPIVVEATVASTATHEKVEAALKKAVYAIGKAGVTQTELDRAKSQIEVLVVRQRDGTYPLASSLGEAVASADWKWFVNYVDAVKSVTAEDVRRVAATYLVPEHATVGWFVPLADAPARGKSQAPSKPNGAPGATSLPPSRPRAHPTDTETPTPAPAIRGRFADRTLHRVLRNGITLNLVPNRSVPTVAVDGIVLAGQMHAPSGNPAVPQLTAMMLSRGTRTRDKRAIAALLDGAGAQLSVAADLTEARIVGSALSRDTRLLLSVLADELSRPAFSDSELVKAKSEMRADLLRAFDNTRTRAFDRLSQIVYPKGHPYLAPDRDEMLAGLDQARKRDLETFHRQRYVGSAIILSIVGDIDTTAVAALVDSLFGGLPRGERPRQELPRVSPGSPERVAVTMRGKANMDLVYGEASGLRRTDPEWNAAIIANAALGQSSLTSRIGKRVRDKEGLSYFLYSRFLWSDHLDGVWMVVVPVAPKNLAQAMRSTMEEIERYCLDGITEEEVETQKNFFAGNYRVRLGTNAGVAFALSVAEKYGHGPAYLDEFPERVRTVTREQVNEVIRARIHPGKLNLVVAGDLETLPQ